MNFSAYIWNLYKCSEEGQRAIQQYQNLEPAKVEYQFGLKYYYPNLTDEHRAIFEADNFAVPQSGNWRLNLVEIFAYLIPLRVNPVERISMRLNLVEIFAYLISLSHFKNIDEVTADYQNRATLNGIDFGTWNKDKVFVFFTLFGEGEFWDDWIYYIENISFGLYCTYPQFYLPYRFSKSFNQLQTICDVFDIPIPDTPTKRDKSGRIQYYALLNHAFYEFRQRHGLSPAEMCAFLYDFAPKACEIESVGTLPEPLKVWLLIAGKGDFEFLDQRLPETSTFWSGNVNTRPGDICIMYCKSPRSYIHSIWRAKTAGFHDPFFYYQNSVYICSPIVTVPITFQEMKAHPYLSQTGQIKSSLQGASGKPLTVEFYEAILEMMQQKGQNMAMLPRLPKQFIPDDVILHNERDVEVHLLEPLLKRLNYTENDWIRQMPVRMGRGERYYPDYVIGATINRGEEKALMLVEAKFRIPDQQTLQDSYFQAKSYALRLQSTKFIIVSAEGIWVFLRTTSGFTFEHKHTFTWEILSHPDLFHQLYLLVGKP